MIFDVIGGVLGNLPPFFRFGHKAVLKGGEKLFVLLFFHFPFFLSTTIWFFFFFFSILFHLKEKEKF